MPSSGQAACPARRDHHTGQLAPAWPASTPFATESAPDAAHSEEGHMFLRCRMCKELGECFCPLDTLCAWF